MRSDIVPGGAFPDYALPDHTGTVRTLSELQGRDPRLRTADHGATGNRHDWLQGTRRVLYGITAEASSCRTPTGACRASSARRRCRPPAASLTNHEVRHRAPRTLTQHGNPNTAT